MKEHFVRTVSQLGWAGVKNGALLKLAEKEFEVFITIDRNLAFQQRLPKFKIAVVVLYAKTNRLDELRQLVPKLLSALPKAKPGKLIRIGV